MIFDILLAGLVLGLVLGVLPGLGPLMTSLLLLPVAIGLPPGAAIGFLSAIFAGGAYSGAFSRIFLGVAGTQVFLKLVLASVVCAVGFALVVELFRSSVMTLGIWDVFALCRVVAL